MVGSDQRLRGGSLQTVGVKGYDGFTFAYVER